MSEVKKVDDTDTLPLSEAKGSFASLFAWIETFHTLDNHLQYEDLLEQAFLHEVIHQIDARPMWSEPIDCAKDPASQIHNASATFVQLVTCYMDCLNQAVLLPVLDIAALINYKSDLSASQQEMHSILLLVLGLAIQSDRKDDFISIMETLPGSVKGDIMESYQELSGHLVRLDSRDDSGALRRCCEDRLALFKKYSHAMQEKYYLEAVVMSSQNFAGPDLLKSLRPPEGLVDFHGYQLLLGSASQQAASLTAQLEDRAAEATQLAAALQLKREKARRWKAQMKGLSASDHAVRMKNIQDENERLTESIKAYEQMETKITSLKQRLADFDFYKARVQELRDENGQLLEERQKAEEHAAALRVHTEAAVERLAECQLRCDDLAGLRDAQADQVATSVARLTAENRRLAEALDALGGFDAASAASAASAAAASASHGSAQSLAAELATAARIRDLESEVRRLTATAASVAAEAGDQRRADELELRVQRLVAERAAEAGEFQRRLGELQARFADAEAAAGTGGKRSQELEQRVQRLLEERTKAEAAARQEIAAAQRSASDGERRATDLERRLREALAGRADAEAAAATARLTAAESEQRAVELEQRLRRLQAERCEPAATAAAEAETELVLQASQELARHLARLGGNNRALRQSCDKLKAELNHLSSVEQEVMQLREARALDGRELQRLESQNRQLRRTLDSSIKAALPPTTQILAPLATASKSSTAVAAAAATPSAGRARNPRPAVGPVRRPGVDRSH